MFVQRGAVEPRQAVRIDRKMRRHPIDQHPQPGAMRAVDETGEPLDIAEPSAGRIQAGGLITPAWVVGMFSDRHEFDMRKAERDDIGDQTIGQLIPGQEPAVFIALP